ncbi:hypothetical protein DY245_42925 [Streptomyces inhibens]|uniref:Uncharacterized protein n=2 Tax=Streptomyces inhibens TaxID=2293571 RepID=A0A371PPR8_STRIH|nr:hypothetical protein DY245_42925 [Streptomyces inhibens]
MRRESMQLRFTPKELKQVADLLQMTWRARVALYRRALRSEPHPSSGGPVTPASDSSWARGLLSQPTCLVDTSFAVLDWNQPFAKLVRVSERRLARGNLMSLLLMEDVAREWADGDTWQEILAAELIEAAALHWTESPHLQQLHEAALDDPVVGSVYEKSAGYTFPERNCKLAMRYLHPGVQEVTFTHAGGLQ